ncbi:lytic transglycosylase domain-containing protein [Brevibacillus sp. SYSU BS000544]|uniref:lytic transglycosylase domain-containing protein n=1 Tax=Brevibacillus sp. SYSU BS000544 TaxID=3416443 RepID=UPI003CE4C05C
MNIDPRTLVMLQSRYGQNTEQLSIPNNSEEMFDQLLEAETSKYRRVVSAEEILADLDGTPKGDYTSDLDDSASIPMYIESRDMTSGKTPVNRQEILSAINRIANRFGVDSDLVREVVRAESNFNPNATSHAGAKGLMQLMDRTARGLQVTNSYDPVQNLTGGTKYLSQLLNRYDGNVKVALAAYNAGPGRIDRLDIDTDAELEQKVHSLPSETQNYVKKIMGRLHGE